MTRTARAMILGAATLTLFTGAPPSDAAGQASRSRPSAEGRGSSGSGARPARTTPTGTASYGHYRSHHGGHDGYYGHGYRYGYGRYGHYRYSPYAYGLYAYGFWPYAGSWYPGTAPAGVYRPNRNAPGVLETDVRPGRSSVVVDGEVVGQARDFNGRWDALWLEPGEHVVEFHREGYQVFRQHVRVPPGGRTRVEARLQKGEGDDPRSTSAFPPAPPERAATSFDVEPVRPDRPSPAASLRRGLVRLQVAPDDAAVYLDGAFLAHASELRRLHGALPMAVGTHTVEVVRPGFESERVEVDVTEGEPRSVEISLERE